MADAEPGDRRLAGGEADDHVERPAGAGAQRDARGELAERGVEALGGAQHGDAALGWMPSFFGSGVPE